jgi:hypothetical protein
MKGDPLTAEPAAAAENGLVTVLSSHSMLGC